MIHQNGESAPNQEHQKKEVNKMGQSQPGGEPMRGRRISQIDCRQKSLGWKPVDQIQAPGNRHRGKSDNGKGKNIPRIYPNTKTSIRWIVDSSMDFVECLHEK